MCINSEKERVEIPIKIVEIEENIPPNPVADDINPTWTMPKEIPMIADKVTSNSWTEYEITETIINTGNKIYPKLPVFLETIDFQRIIIGFTSHPFGTQIMNIMC